MDFFAVLKLLGGVALFLFAMNVMGEALENQAGSRLEELLGRLTTGKGAGFLTGLTVTAVIQSSSAATVMVVGFVNAGLLSLQQAVHVIMGANVGTTVTSWVLSLAGLESDHFLARLLRPEALASVAALGGIVLYTLRRWKNGKNIGRILLGFGVLMTAMEIMSTSVAPLKESEQFRRVLTWFDNPLLGVLAGAALTAVLQSSSASVGILQALSATGQVTAAGAVPIILGQNIGTCVTALLASVGTGVNARRAAVVHLLFNVTGAAAALVAFLLLRGVLPAGPMGPVGIALTHTAFNAASTALLLPFSGLLERVAVRLVRH